MGAGIGSALAGPAGAMAGAALVPAVGAVSKTLADRATARNVDDLLRIIAAGGSRNAAFSPPNAAQRAIGAAVPVVPGALANIGSGAHVEDKASRRKRRRREREVDREARKAAAAD